jgi:hypothetical protein
MKCKNYFVVMPAEAGTQGLHGIARFARDDINSTVAARGATKVVAPVRRREHTLSVFATTPPHPAFAGMTATDSRNSKQE